MPGRIDEQRNTRCRTLSIMEVTIRLGHAVSLYHLEAGKKGRGMTLSTAKYTKDAHSYH